MSKAYFFVVSSMLKDPGSRPILGIDNGRAFLTNSVRFSGHSSVRSIQGEWPYTWVETAEKYTAISPIMVERKNWESYFEFLENRV